MRIHHFYIEFLRFKLEGISKLPRNELIPRYKELVELDIEPLNIAFASYIVRLLSPKVTHHDVKYYNKAKQYIIEEKTYSIAEWEVISASATVAFREREHITNAFSVMQGYTFLYFYNYFYQMNILGLSRTELHLFLAKYLSKYVKEPSFYDFDEFNYKQRRNEWKYPFPVIGVQTFGNALLYYQKFGLTTNTNIKDNDLLLGIKKAFYGGNVFILCAIDNNSPDKIVYIYDAFWLNALDNPISCIKYEDEVFKPNIEKDFVPMLRLVGVNAYPYGRRSYANNIQELYTMQKQGFDYYLTTTLYASRSLTFNVVVAQVVKRHFDTMLELDIGEESVQIITLYPNEILGLEHKDHKEKLKVGSMFYALWDRVQHKLLYLPNKDVYDKEYVSLDYIIKGTKEVEN